MASFPATNHVLVTALPETQMLPPPTQQAFGPQRYTKREWEAHKCMIEGPWKDFKIKDVVNLLKDRGFYITERQLKGRIKTWGLGKNVRSTEMKAIVRKQAQSRAEGKISRYRVRGNHVEESKIIRWQKANESYGQVLEQGSISTSPQAATPSDISCSTITPIGSPAPSLTSFGLVPNLNPTGKIAISSTRSPEGMSYQSHLTMTAPPSPAIGFAPSVWHLLQHDEESFEGRSPAPYSAPATPLPENNGVTNTISLSADHVENSFEGRSPMPFSAPSSPLLQKSRVESTVGFAANQPHMYDGEKAQYRQVQHIGGFDGRQNASFSQYIEQQELMSSDFSRILPQRDGNLPSKKYVRYKQKEEDELSERLKTFEARHGTTHPATLDTALRLLYVYLDQSRYRTAESLCQKIVRGWHETVGDSDLRTLLAFKELATIYHFRGKLRKAEILARWTYTMSLSTLGPSHPQLLVIRHGLASCYLSLSRDQEAEALIRENIRVGTLNLPPDSFVLLAAMFALADLLKYRGQFVESRKIVSEILLSLEISSTPNQNFLLKVKNLLGVLLYEQNDASAGMFVRNLHQDSVRIFGPEHLLTLDIQSTLALCLTNSNAHEESVSLFRDCVKKSMEIGGSQNPTTIRFELDLAHVLMRRKEYSEAEAISEKSSRIATTEFGPSHHLTHLSAIRLGQCYHGQGDLEKATTILSATLTAQRQLARLEDGIWRECVSSLEKVEADLRKSQVHGATGMFSQPEYAWY